MSDPLGLIGTSGAGRGGGIQPLGLPKGPGDVADAAGGGPSFKDVLMKHIDQVNNLQADAQRAIEDLTTGKRDDVANVLIAQRKAELAFDLLQQVRNKMVDAYDEIKNMRV